MDERKPLVLCYDPHSSQHQDILRKLHRANCAVLPDTCPDAGEVILKLEDDNKEYRGRQQIEAFLRSADSEQYKTQS